MCLTGGSDGVIRRWDLSGERTKKEADVKQWATNTATNTNKSPATTDNKITPSSAPTATATTASASSSPVPVAAAAVARVLPPRQRFLDFYFQDAIDAMQQTTASTITTNSNARASNIKTDRATASSTPTTTASSTPIDNSDGNGSGVSGSGATKVGLSSQLKDAVDSYRYLPVLFSLSLFTRFIPLSPSLPLITVPNHPPLLPPHHLQRPRAHVPRSSLTGSAPLLSPFVIFHSHPQ